MSRELRNTIREMVEKGKTNQQIYNYVEQTYGPDQVAVPRRGLMSRLSYGFPYVVMGLLSVIATWFAWRWTRPESADTNSTGDDSESDEDRELVERALEEHGDPLS